MLLELGVRMVADSDTELDRCEDTEVEGSAELDEVDCWMVLEPEFEFSTSVEVSAVEESASWKVELVKSSRDDA